MAKIQTDRNKLLQEINQLNAKLKIAEETINVLQSKKADAIIGLDGNLKKVFLIHDAIEPYRLMLESMNEGAVSVLADGTIIYLNNRLAEMLSIDQKKAAGKNILKYVQSDLVPVFKKMLLRSLKKSHTMQLSLINREKRKIEVKISFHKLDKTGSKAKPLMLVITDMTEIKKANDLIALSEQKFRNVLNNSRDIIYEYSLTSNKYLYISPSCKDIYCLPAEHFIGKSSAEAAQFILPEYIPAVQNHRKKITKKSSKAKGVFSLEYEICNLEGDKRWLSNTHTVIYNKSGRAESIIGSISDITYRKIAQDELKRAYELQKGYVNLLTTMQDALPAHISLLDKDGFIVTVNESWRKFGELNSLADKSYGVGLNYIQVCEEATGNCSEEAREAALGIKKVLSGKLSEFTLEYPCHAPFEHRWFRLISAPINKNNNSGAVVMHINVTDRKLAELALKESEFQYRRLFDEDLTGNYVARPDGSVMLCNQSFVDILGYKKKNQILDNPKFNIFSEEHGNIEFIKKLERREKIPAHERDIFRMDGKRITVIENILGNYDMDGKLYSVQGYILDITKIKESQLALENKTREISLLYEAGKRLSSSLELDEVYSKIYDIIRSIIPCDSMVISSFDENKQVINCRAAWIKDKQLEANKFPEMPLDKSGIGIQSRAIIEKKSLILEDIEDYVNNNKSIVYVHSDNTLTKDLKRGDEINKAALIVPLTLKGNVLGVIQVMSYKRAAYNTGHLRLLEAFSAQITAATANSKLYEEAQNEIAEREKAEDALIRKTSELQLLYDAQRELIGNLDLNSVYDNSYRIITSLIQNDCMIISAFSQEDNLIRVRSVWASGYKATLADIQPIPLAPKGFGIQSEVIRNRRPLLTSDYKSYFEKSLHKITVSDNVAESKPRSLYSSAIIIPMIFNNEVIGTIQILSFKENAYTENDLRLLESITTSITAAKANAKLHIKAQKEIEKRAKKEQELLKIKKNLEEAQRIAHIGSWEYLLDGNEISNSAEVFNILGIKNVPENLILEESWGYIHPEDIAELKEQFRNCIKTHKKYELESRIIHEDKTVRYVKIVGEPMYAETGELKGVHGTIQDISDIKTINNELKKSLNEKELMIKEIHHRVKNNLQIVSSLLRLQSDSIADKTAIAHLKMSEQRVKSMALIHQQLYRTKDLSRIDFREYIEDLCNYLFFSYDISFSRVSLEFDIDEIYFGIDTALPCGLIINELVTNSIKHAFPDYSIGSMVVKLKRMATGKYILTIKDDGIGVGDIDFENTSTLGMELVKTLTQQLDGEIKVNTEKGTEISILFFDQNKE